MTVSNNELKDILRQTLRFARERDYCGYDKADGMSSRILRSLPFDNRWVNLAFQETTKRSPINIRPFLFVEQRRNFKGMALFACANLAAEEILKSGIYEDEAKACLDWLVANQSDGYAGYCGGHQHSVQGLQATVPPNTPGIVGTSYAVRALLRGRTLDPDLRDRARTAAAYVFEDLDYHEVPAGARIRYKPSDDDYAYTLNANALGARLLIDLYDHTSNERLREASRKILAYVVANQTEIGGWEYRDPPSASHLSMDNYHNGFIVESLLRYREITGEDVFRDALEDSLDFYRNVLFNDNGAPNWDEENRYPKDIHAAAQGILVFTYAGQTEFARKILYWTLDNLYTGDGQFYYQKRRFYTKRFTLMRWCQAWMAYVMSEFLTHTETGG